MTYVNGFVAAVPTANKDRFIEHARLAAEVFKEHGALSVMECWGTDVPGGETTSFPMAVKCRDDETVAFSWIVWPDKETSERAMGAMMDDPRMSQQNNPMPFDGKRMIYGGFEPVMEA